MSKYLVSSVETYRVDSEAEVDELISNAKEDNIYELSKFSSQKKEVKQKGELVDSYFLVSLTKIFTSAKEPEIQVNVEYNI